MPSYDEANRNAIASNVGGGAQDGSVVLMHDLRSSCYRYLKPILERLEARGFLCVTVEELFAIRGKEPEAGAVYRSLPPG